MKPLWRLVVYIFVISFSPLAFSAQVLKEKVLTCKDYKKEHFSTIEKATEKLGDPLSMQIYDVVDYTWKSGIYTVVVTVSDGKFSALDAPEVCGKPVKPEHENYCAVYNQLVLLLGQPVTLAQLQDIVGAAPNSVNESKGATYHWEKDTAIIEMRQENGAMLPLSCSPVVREQEQQNEEQQKQEQE